MSLFNNKNDRKSHGSSIHRNSLGGISKRDSKISHSSIHDSMHKKDFHKSIHDHNKIHEGMHLGKDKVISPFNHGK